MISADTMTGIASCLESMSHDACLGHNDVRMTPQMADVLAKCIKDYVYESKRPTCSMEYLPEYSGDELYPTEVYRCSRCGWFVHEGKTGYCPNCGAEVLDEDGAN